MTVIELCGYGPRAEGPRSQWLLRRAILVLNCRAVRITANSRLLPGSHSILTGQIEKFSQAAKLRGYFYE